MTRDTKLGLIFFPIMVGFAMASAFVSLWFMIPTYLTVFVFTWFLMEGLDTCAQRGRLLGFSRRHLFRYTRGGKVKHPDIFTQDDGSDVATCTVCDYTITGTMAWEIWYD